MLAAALLAASAACSGEAPKEHPPQSSSSRPSPGSSAEHDTGRPEQGPYKVRSRTVSSADVDGHFRSGTLRYPDDGKGKGKGGDHAVIAASPGLGADESMVTPYGKLLASHGFVVITFNTRTTEDSPSQRGRQLLHALDYVTERSAVADRTDPHRLGVLGHSMGGGGALYAASRDRDIKAAVPLTPYSERRDWPRVEAPTLVIGGSTDEIAPVPQHAEAFYEGLSGADEKEYLELRGDHFVATPPDRLVAAQVVAWFKRFLDDDASGSAAPLCPPPRTDRITESRDTCPFD